jgi:hypothetical protein
MAGDGLVDQYMKGLIRCLGGSEPLAQDQAAAAAQACGRRANWRRKAAGGGGSPENSPAMTKQASRAPFAMGKVLN